MRGVPAWAAVAGVLVAGAATGACGGGEAPSPASAGEPPAAAAPRPPEAPSAPPEDHGAPSDTYPAFAPSVPQLQNKGGHVLTSPVAVTVAWNDSANAGVFEQLVDRLGATSYWRDVVSEYGVGPLTSGAANHVRLTTPIELPTDPDQDPVLAIEELVRDSLTDTASSGWPEPTDQSVYILYFSGQVAQQLCEEGMGGMHESVAVKGRQVAYAIAMECDGDPMMTALESATVSVSHELAEASVDPYPDADPAWQGLDRDHLAWELFQQGQDENSDMCELYDDSYGPHAMPEISLFVQRSWSNASVVGGHDPCVPAPKRPYFNVTPLGADDDLVADFGDFDVPINPRSKGVRVRVGETRKIPIGFYSDGPTEPFLLQAFELDPFDPYADPMGGGGSSAKDTLELSLDRDEGRNGEKAYLTVKVNGTSSIGVTLVVLQTTLGDVTHFMPLLVGGDPPDPSQKLDRDGTPGGGARRIRALPRRLASYAR
jgi:hypothetical protein